MAKKRDDTAPLAALRILLKPLAISLEPLTHQVSALPTEPDLEYYFVSAEHMKLFQPYHQPGQPYKNLKLVNYGRPAISLAFFSKHKYKIERDADPQKALTYLQEHRDTLYNQSFLEQLSADQQQKLQQVDELLRVIRRQPNAYQLAFSNYHHYYRYWYCSFRYFETEDQTKNKSENEHLLKHTERLKGQIHQRLNIIFVDTHYITRPVPIPQDNKRVDRELDNYLIRIEAGKTALYVKEASLKIPEDENQ